MYTDALYIYMYVYIYTYIIIKRLIAKMVTARSRLEMRWLNHMSKRIQCGLHHEGFIFILKLFLATFCN